MSESSDSPPPDSNSNSPPPPSNPGGGSGSSPPNYEQNTSQSQSPPSHSNSNSSPPTPPSSPPPSGGGSAPPPKSKSPPPSPSPPPKESAPPKSSPAPKASRPPPSPPPSPPPPPSSPSNSSSPAPPPPHSPPPSSPPPPPPPHSPPPSSTHNISSGASGNSTQSPSTPPASTGSASQSPPSPVSPSTTQPATPGTPVAKTNPNPNPTETPANVLSPPTGSSSGSSRAPPRSSSNSVAPAPSIANDSETQTGTIVGLTVAGVFVIALVAFIFLFIRKKKKQSPVYPPNYFPPPHGTNLDGYYHGQQPSTGNSGPAEIYFTNGHPPPISTFENSYGSHRERGNAYGSAGAGESDLIAATKVHFSYEELMDITNGFNRLNVLGEGGFGCVYKGWLPEGKEVAVKQLKAGSGQGEKEFRAEVEIISRVHHRHLVSLVGYCISEQQRLLIYEFVPNQTLEHHLHGAGMPVLEWTKRLKIALGSAKGLAYLHEDCHPKIIHRDIKSANILLDDAFEAQVADFGLAKLTNDTNTHVSTRVMGTFGYMAPEYANSGKLTDRSDVFSFGVVLLELVTGRKPVDPTQPLGDESLVEWARPLLIQGLETGDLSQLVDPRLEKHYVEGEMFRMVEAAAACVRHSATKRPRMAQVVRALDCESDLTNGVKVGESTAYDSAQYNEDIMRFRRTALGSESSSEYDISSSEFSSRDVSGPQRTWNRPDGSSGESETQAFNTSGDEQRFNGSQNRRF